MIQREDIEKNYVNAPEAGKILNITRNRVTKLCAEGRFLGAIKIGSSWIIPREAILNHKPLPPGVKSKKAQLTAERQALLAEAKKVKEVSQP